MSFDDAIALANQVALSHLGGDDLISSVHGDFVAIFDEPTKETTLNVNKALLNFSVSTPQILCDSGIASLQSEGEILTIKGKEYSIVEILPDGTGMTVIHLVIETEAQADGVWK